MTQRAELHQAPASGAPSAAAEDSETGAPRRTTRHISGVQLKTSSGAHAGDTSEAPEASSNRRPTLIPPSGGQEEEAVLPELVRHSTPSVALPFERTEQEFWDREPTYTAVSLVPPGDTASPPAVILPHRKALARRLFEIAFVGVAALLGFEVLLLLLR